MKKPQPTCPECEKLAKVSEESNKIGDFLSWMFRDGDTPYFVCEWNDEHRRYYSIALGDSKITEVLAQYFGVDLDKVEQERRALLDWLREEQE